MRWRLITIFVIIECIAILIQFGALFLVKRPSSELDDSLIVTQTTAQSSIPSSQLTNALSTSSEKNDHLRSGSLQSGRSVAEPAASSPASVNSNHIVDDTTDHDTTTKTFAKPSTTRASAWLKEQAAVSKPLPTTRKDAVIHVGPHKTGTTTVQNLSLIFRKYLKKDNYHMPWMNFKTGKTMTLFGPNQVNLATCFFSDTTQDEIDNPHTTIDTTTETIQTVYPCDEKLLSTGLEIAAKNKNIFISTEEFDRRYVDVKALKDYLRPWDRVRIVVYYRRYYDWILSIYNEMMKTRNIEMYVPAFRDMDIFDERGETFYTHQVHVRYKKVFDDVVVMNMHDKKKDLAEKFYCDVMPHADQMCQSVQKKKKMEENRTNKSSGGAYIGYRGLALAASHKDYIEFESEDQLNFAIEQIQNYQENTLARSYDDFQKICPSQEQYDFILERSLLFEKELVPEFFASSLGEAGLRSGFEKAKLKMCSIDYEEVLGSEEWSSFFSSLQILNSIPNPNRINIIHSAET